MAHQSKSLPTPVLDELHSMFTSMFNNVLRERDAPFKTSMYPFHCCYIKASTFTIWAKVVLVQRFCCLQPFFCHLVPIMVIPFKLCLSIFPSFALQICIDAHFKFVSNAKHLLLYLLHFLYGFGVSFPPQANAMVYLIVSSLLLDIDVMMTVALHFGGEKIVQIRIQCIPFILGYMRMILCVRLRLNQLPWPVPFVNKIPQFL